MTWDRVRLKDVGTWYGGGTPSKSNPSFWTDGDVPWLSPKDMGAEVLTSTIDHVTDAAVTDSSTKLVPAGVVAIVTRSGILERTLPVALVPFATTMNQDMKAVSPREGIDPRWIAWGLRAYERELLRETRKAGTTVASIEMPRFYEFELPLPAPDEQHRIVAILEDHLSRLDAAAAGIRTAARRLGQLREVALASAIAEARVTEGVTIHRLGDLAKIGSGMTPLRGNKAFYEGGTIPWITSGDLHQGRITGAKNFVTEEALKQTTLKVVPAGSLLIAMYGEGKTRGTTAELALDAATNQACASVTLHDPTLRSWVRLVLDANYAGLRRLAAGGVQPNLNLTLVKAIEIPVPPAAEREELARRVAEVDDAAAKFEEELGKAAHRGTVLRRSLLTAAFLGRLPGVMSEVSKREEMIDV